MGSGLSVTNKDIGFFRTVVYITSLKNSYTKA